MNKGIKWIIKNTGYAFWSIIILCLLGVAMSYCGMHFAFASKTVMDIATGASDKGLINAVLVLCLLIVSQIVIHIMYSIVEIKVNCNLINKLQANLFSKILTREYLGITSLHSGELVNRLTNDVTQVAGHVMTLLPTICMLVAKVAFSFGALYLLDKKFALICLVIMPFVTVAGRLYGKRMKNLHKKCSTAKGNIISYMQEIIRNVLVVKAFVKENVALQQLGKLQDESLKLSVKRSVISLFANLMFFAVMTFGYYCALVWCAYKISIGIMTVGTLTAILQLFDQLQTPFADFSGVIPGYYQMMASVERITELEEQAADVAEKQTDIEDVEYIKLDKVSFSYGNEPLLNDVSYTFKKGDIAVIGGLSGIGKSTLMKIIMGVIKPDSGNVIISDGISEYNCDASVRKCFAYVPQGNMILSGSVRDNITFFDSTIPEADIISAAQNACIYDYISELPDGLDTVLGEDGSGMSEGQIQRIAIARALCNGSCVIMLDEATSALDEETEKRVLENIKAQNKTCIVISHKKCAFEMCDTVITL